MFKYIAPRARPQDRVEKQEELTVVHKYRSDFRLDGERLICRGCWRILRNGEVWGRGSHGGYGAPALSVRFFHPHLCLLSFLKEVEKLYRSGVLPEKLYDRWMAANGASYQLGSGEACMGVWSEVVGCSPARPPVAANWLEIVGRPPAYVSFVHCPKHGCFYVRIKWNEIGNDKDSMHVFQRIWQFSSGADAAKTTVNAGNMIWHMRKMKTATDLYDKWSHLFSVNLPNVTITCMLIHTCANPEAGTMFDLLSGLDMCCMHTESYQEVMKLISVALRRTAKFANGEPASLDQVCLLAGWELAIGRSLNKSDWEEEREKRVEQVVPLGLPLDGPQTSATNEVYLAKLRPILRQILMPAVRPMKRKYSWLEHVENRQSWVSSGSTGGKRLRLSDGTVVRMNKHAYFETLTSGEMVKWLDREPAIYATGSEKMEPGKKRAIYGSDPVDYSIHDYVIRRVEGLLSQIDGLESGLLGRDYVSSTVRRVHAIRKPGVEGTMIDYKDFNYQHTLLAQAEVFLALKDCFITREYHPDHVRACQWTADSFLNQYVKFPTLGTGYLKVSQGMFSGVRPTNFINTVLNLGYFRVAQDWVKENFSLEAADLHNIHQGDDVWITNQSRLWAIALFGCMEASGLQFQGSKQLFDRGRGEFLRVMYTLEGCKAYVARAVASFVVKPIQSADVVSPLERATSLSEHVAIMKRRGFTEEGCAVVWRATVPFAASAKLGSSTISVPTNVLIKHHRDNGLGLAIPGCAAKRGVVIAALPRMVLGSRLLENELPTNMAADWVKIVSRIVQAPLRSEALVKTLHQSNVSDSLRNEDRVQALSLHLKDLGKWLAKNRAGAVECNKAIHDQLLLGERAGSLVEADMREACAYHSPKLSRKRPTKLAMLEMCIAGSPFKSVSNTQIAMGAGVIEAVTMAVSQSTNQVYKEETLCFIHAVRSVCGDDILRYLLDGPKTIAGSFLGTMHPLVLYWVQDMAIDEAVSLSLSRKLKKVDDVKDLVESTFLRYFRSALQQPMLLQISHY
nr:MAG: RNA-dependent RNA polymerase [XiangYun toti-like virus 9]